MCFIGLHGLKLKYTHSYAPAHCNYFVLNYGLLFLYGNCKKCGKQVTFVCEKIENYNEKEVDEIIRKNNLCSRSSVG